MTQLICNDCKFAVAGWSGETQCPILERAVNEKKPCQVNRDGLLMHFRQRIEPMRDEADDLSDLLLRMEDDEADLDDRWPELSDAEHERLRRIWRDTFGLRWKLDELNQEVAKWKDALNFLWGRSRAPNRQCPKCDFIPIDSTADYCGLCGSALLLRPKQKSASRG